MGQRASYVAKLGYAGRAIAYARGGGAPGIHARRTGGPGGQISPISPWYSSGSPGGQVTGDSNGQSASGFGNGGGGACTDGDTNRWGGAGAPGAIWLAVNQGSSAFFTSGTPGSYNIVAPSDSMYVIGQGAGASGGGVTNNGDDGFAAGGGAGGTRLAIVSTVPGRTYTVVIGAGGPLAANVGNGYAGGPTYIVDTVTGYTIFYVGGGEGGNGDGNWGNDGAAGLPRVGGYGGSSGYHTSVLPGYSSAGMAATVAALKSQLVRGGTLTAAALREIINIINSISIHTHEVLDYVRLDEAGNVAGGAYARGIITEYPTGIDNNLLAYPSNFVPDGEITAASINLLVAYVNALKVHNHSILDQIDP